MPTHHNIKYTCYDDYYDEEGWDDYDESPKSGYGQSPSLGEYMFSRSPGSQKAQDTLAGLFDGQKMGPHQAAMSEKDQLAEAMQASLTTGPPPGFDLGLSAVEDSPGIEDIARAAMVMEHEATLREQPTSRVADTAFGMVEDLSPKTADEQRRLEAEISCLARQAQWETQEREWALEKMAEDEVMEEFDAINGGAHGICSSPVLYGKDGFKDQRTQAASGKKKGGKGSNKASQSQELARSSSEPEQAGKGTKNDRGLPRASSLTRAASTSSEEGGKVELQRPATKAMQRDLDAALSERRAADVKTRLSMVVVGHVDAGKSTLMGHLLFEIGEVSQKIMHKYDKLSREAGKASFSYAWVMDEQEEERSRGVTIDCGMKAFETPTKSITLLDAPGHRDFIPNMISGAAQADVACLVVDAGYGGFEGGFDSGGQTKEHAQLLYSLGIRQVVVVVNKLDMVDWSQERFDEICAKMSSFLQKQGFKAKGLRYVPVSGLTGQNLCKRDEAALDEWYKGATLFEAIDAFNNPPRIVDSPLRLCVTDVFKSAALGNSFAGKIEAGTLAVGDRLLLAPTSTMVTVKGLEIEGVPVKWAFAGDNVDVGFTGAELNAIAQGFVACDPAQPVRVAKRFEAQILCLELARPLLKGGPLVFHMQSAQYPAVLNKLISTVDRKGQASTKKPRCLTAGMSANVEIKLEKSVCVEDYASCKPLGRFMLRETSHTAALGIVTKIKC